MGLCSQATSLAVSQSACFTSLASLSLRLAIHDFLLYDTVYRYECEPDQASFMAWMSLARNTSSLE